MLFQDDWRLVSGISSAFCVGTLILTYFIPESPSWLISRGRMTEAKESLAFIRAVKKNGKNANIKQILYIVYIFIIVVIVLTYRFRYKSSIKNGNGEIVRANSFTQYTV